MRGPRAKHWAGKFSGKTITDFNKSFFLSTAKYMTGVVEI